MSAFDPKEKWGSSPLAAGQEPFVWGSDGITEDIITGLSQFKDLDVVARNSTFRYKGQSADVREVGHELPARYVLEGSVHKAGDVRKENSASVWKTHWTLFASTSCRPTSLVTNQDTRKSSPTRPTGIRTCRSRKLKTKLPRSAYKLPASIPFVTIRCRHASRSLPVAGMPPAALALGNSLRADANNSTASGSRVTSPSMKK